MIQSFPPDNDTYRVERVLATARLVVSAGFALVLHAEALTAPPTPVLTVCTLAYVAYSAVVFVALPW